MLDILISQHVNVNVVIALLILGVVYILHRIVRRFNKDMRWVYAEYEKLLEENDRLKLQNLQLHYDFKNLKDENAKLNVQVLKSLDKLDIERTK